MEKKKNENKKKEKRKKKCIDLKITMEPKMFMK